MSTLVKIDLTNTTYIWVDDKQLLINSATPLDGVRYGVSCEAAGVALFCWDYKYLTARNGEGRYCYKFSREGE